MMDDWVHIQQIRLYGYHGVYAHEREQGQTFEIDVDLCADLSKAGASDKVEDTIDYVRVYRVVERVVTGPSHHLLETVADIVARELLRLFPARQVVIRIRKPRVQMPGPVGSVEIEIRRP